MDASLGMDDIASLFGVGADALPDACRKIILESDLSYRRPTGAELDRVLLRVIKSVDESKQIVRSSHANSRAWNGVWQQNLDSLLEKGYSDAVSIPPYFTPPDYVRLRREYVIPNSQQFFLNVYTAYRIWAFTAYLSGFQTIYEFGCGSCNNLVLLERLFPECYLMGLDVASPPIEMARYLASSRNWKMDGRLFDIFHPDSTLKLAANSAVLTVTALEQIGAHHEPFLQYLMRQRPAICIHLEPISEWYDEDNLVDYLALRYHRNLGYLENFYTRVNALAAEGKAQLITARRLEFGGDCHDAWSLLVWRPLPDLGQNAGASKLDGLKQLIGLR